MFLRSAAHPGQRAPVYLNFLNPGSSPGRQAEPPHDAHLTDEEMETPRGFPLWLPAQGAGGDNEGAQRSRPPEDWHPGPWSKALCVLIPAPPPTSSETLSKLLDLSVSSL